MCFAIIGMDFIVKLYLSVYILYIYVSNYLQTTLDMPLDMLLKESVRWDQRVSTYESNDKSAMRLWLLPSTVLAKSDIKHS